MDIGVVRVSRKDQHFYVWSGFAHLPGGLQPVHLGHSDIHQNHVGSKLQGQGYCLASVLRFADDEQIRFEFEHLANSFADDLVILSDHDGDLFHVVCWNALVKGICARIVVPRPGEDSISKVPPTISARSLIPRIPSRLEREGASIRFGSNEVIVIANRQANAEGLFPDGNLHPDRLGMTVHIGERFLGNAKENRPAGGIEILHFQQTH